jgi:hypothetical protein
MQSLPDTMLAMALREIDEGGRIKDVLKLPYEEEFNDTWLRIPAAERQGMEAEINHRLDELIASPSPNYGSTNTSIEGGKVNQETGEAGDWTGTPFQWLYEACNHNAVRAGMIYGNLWKKAIIERPEMWIGIRPDPTFKNRGSTWVASRTF